MICALILFYKYIDLVFVVHVPGICVMAVIHPTTRTAAVIMWSVVREYSVPGTMGY